MLLISDVAVTQYNRINPEPLDLPFGSDNSKFSIDPISLVLVCNPEGKIKGFFYASSKTFQITRHGG